MYIFTQQNLRTISDYETKGFLNIVEFSVFLSIILRFVSQTCMHFYHSVPKMRRLK